MPGGGGNAMFMTAGEELGSRLKQLAGGSSSRAGGGGRASAKKSKVLETKQEMATGQQDVFMSDFAKLAQFYTHRFHIN